MADRSARVTGDDTRLAAAVRARLTADGLGTVPDVDGPVDVLVHLVAAPPAGAFVGADVSSWYGSVLDALTPALQTVRSAVPALRQSTSGRIVLVSAGWFPASRADSTAAAAVSGAVVALTKTLARDLGPDGITVNQVVHYPAAPADDDLLASAVAYLCSWQAGAVTGQLLTVGSGGPLRP